MVMAGWLPVALVLAVLGNPWVGPAVAPKRGALDGSSDGGVVLGMLRAVISWPGADIRDSREDPVTHVLGRPDHSLHGDVVGLLALSVTLAVLAVVLRVAVRGVAQRRLTVVLVGWGATLVASLCGGLVLIVDQLTRPEPLITLWDHVTEPAWYGLVCGLLCGLGALGAQRNARASSLPPSAGRGADPGLRIGTRRVWLIALAGWLPAALIVGALQNPWVTDSVLSWDNETSNDFNPPVPRLLFDELLHDVTSPLAPFGQITGTTGTQKIWEIAGVLITLVVFAGLLFWGLRGITAHRGGLAVALTTWGAALLPTCCGGILVAFSPPQLVYHGYPPRATAFYVIPAVEHAVTGALLLGWVAALSALLAYTITDRRTPRTAPLSRKPQSDRSST